MLISRYNLRRPFVDLRLSSVRKQVPWKKENLEKIKLHKFNVINSCEPSYEIYKNKKNYFDFMKREKL